MSRYVDNKPAFDINSTVHWVGGVLKDPNGTAVAYRDQQPTWRDAFIQIVVPLYLAVAVVGFLSSMIFGGAVSIAASADNPTFFVVAMAWSVTSTFVVAFIIDYLAGVFGGGRNFDRAYATVALAIVPAVLAGVLTPVAWLGGLIGLAGVIYTLVLVYVFIGIFMTVPEDKRVVHYVVSLVVVFVVNLLVGGVLAAAFVAEDVYEDMQPAEVEPAEQSGGVFSGFQRQADFAERAMQDTYDPPEDGRLTEAQVAAYARTLQRTAELRERLSSNLEKMEKEEGPSLGDVFSGVQDAVRLGTAEMEVVKSAGGNWAEHEWVKGQIETARVQKDGNPVIEHNYELFLEYQDRIEQYE